MASPPPAPTIDLLLTLIDTRPASILTSLAAHPHLASTSDAHGYSLVHAAVSYDQPTVLRELVRTHNVNVNLLDEDGETALFVAETADIARSLVEEYGADYTIRNTEGKTAEEKIGEEEGADHEVYLYLRGLRGPDAESNGATLNGNAAGEDEMDGVEGQSLPAQLGGFNVNVGSMTEEDVGDAPDPEFRRRIEELAAREDFQTEEGQRQLRELVLEVVSGMGSEEADRAVRRRVE